MDMMLDPTAAAELRELELSYTERVNMAVAEDRLDLVHELVRDFQDQVERLERVA
jgi:hypothetical protein